MFDRLFACCASGSQQPIRPARRPAGEMSNPAARPLVGEPAVADQFIPNGSAGVPANVSPQLNAAEKAQLNRQIYDALKNTFPSDDLSLQAVLENGQDHNRRNWLHWAVLAGDVEVVKLALRHGGKEAINQLDNVGRAPLHWAAKSEKANSAEVIQLLLNQGALEMIGHADHLGETPLHGAAYSFNANVVELILQQPGGAQSINQRDIMECVPLHWPLVVSPIKRDVALALIREGAAPALLPEHIRSRHQASLAEIWRAVLDEKWTQLAQDGLSEREKRALLNQVGRLWRSGAPLKDGELAKLVKIARDVGHIEAMKAFSEGIEDPKYLGLTLAGIETPNVFRTTVAP